MIAVHPEQHPGGIEDGFSSVLAHHCGCKSECAHLKDVGVAEHFMESPCVGRDDFVGVAIAAEVSPFINSNRNRFGTERGNALEVFLIVLVFRTHLDGGCAFPFNE